MNIKFSIIVPYHNSTKDDRRKWMDALLASVPDRKDTEIIFVDDNSTVSWTPHQKHTNTIIHLLQNNSGERYAGAARNVGIDASTGTHLIFADSDDFFSNEFEQIMEDAISSENTWTHYMFKLDTYAEENAASDRHSYRNFVLDKAKHNHAELLKYHSPAGRIIRKDFLIDNDIKFSTTQWGNDFMFSVKMALLCPKADTHINDKKGYVIRSSENSTVMATSIKSIQCRLQLAAEANKFLAAHENVVYRFFADDIAHHRSKTEFWKAFKSVMYAKRLDGTKLRHPKTWPLRLVRRTLKEKAKQ